MVYASKEQYLSEHRLIPDEQIERRLKQASRHIDSLTFNRITSRGFNNLTEFQQGILIDVCCEMADFEFENEDMINCVLQNYQLITYTNNTTAKTTPAIISTHGATGAKGDAGADAITVTIICSNGRVFKNNTGNTVLTAHVFKGSIEQTITDAGVVSGLGSIKWYKAGSTTALATAKTLTVSANDVDNTQAYTCQLED